MSRLYTMPTGRRGSLDPNRGGGMRHRRRPAAVAFAGALVACSLAAGSAQAAPKPPPGPQLVYPNVVEEVPSHLGIENDHQREWLRFTTTHINLGPGNLQIRG